MSIQINHIRSVLLVSLPLLLLVVSVCFATWEGLQSTPFFSESRLMLHQALIKMPPEPSEISKTSPERSGSDPFFHNPAEVDGAVKGILEMTNLEEIHLTTIAQGKQGRYCIVNGEIFHEKQAGKSFIVDKIAQGQVDFQTNLESFFLLPGQKTAIQAGKRVSLEKVAVSTLPPLDENQTALYE